MYRPVIFVVFIVVVSVADDAMEKCLKLINSDVYSCCPTIPKSIKPLKLNFEDELKECYDLPMPEPTSCVQAECVAKKKGYFAADGSFDRKAYSNLLDKEFNFDADLLAAVKEVCVEGVISEYGPSTMCDFLKMRNCVHFQLLENCPEWNDKDECSGIKDLVAECVEE